MSIFGWSHPPGAANDPNAPYNQTDDGPCDVCGQAVDDCVCPECPVCTEVGNPRCYENHGLVRSFAQVALLAEAEAQWAGEAEAENAYYREEFNRAIYCGNCTTPNTCKFGRCIKESK